MTVFALEDRTLKRDEKMKPELFIGLVGATGTPLDELSLMLRDAFGLVGYQTHTVKLSKLIEEIGHVPPQSHEADRIEKCMDAGDALRLLHGNNYVGLLAVTAIRKHRKDINGPIENHGADISAMVPLTATAYIIDSLKHPEEVNTLRSIYGRSFYLLSAYSREKNRCERLQKKFGIKDGDHYQTEFDRNEKAVELMKRDKNSGLPNGQQVSKTFPLADFFVDSDKQDSTKRSFNGKIEYRLVERFFRGTTQHEIDRFVALLFGDTFRTPTREEYCMFHAHAAALRSADLGRQVGAAIATIAGDIVAVGTNEVPKAGGGQYWDGDPDDHRDFKQGHDANDVRKRRIFDDILLRLSTSGHLVMNEEQMAKLSSEIFSPFPPKDFKEAEFLDVIGFYRAVHAETAALLDASRRGVSTKDATMYVTTFPCHECARHIVAAGIGRVLYIEPYPKSLASEHYPDSICVDAAEADKINFESFVGVAPRQYIPLFTKTKRKRENSAPNRPPIPLISSHPIR